MDASLGDRPEVDLGGRGGRREEGWERSPLNEGKDGGGSGGRRGDGGACTHRGEEDDGGG